jgi:ribosome modulation factor
MGDTRNTPPGDVTVPIGAWKRGYDVGLYTPADDPKWRDKCPYRSQSPEAQAWTSGFIEGRAARRKA